jgi:DNA-binding beta-propeller fold protein YncE
VRGFEAISDPRGPSGSVEPTREPDQPPVTLQEHHQTWISSTGLLYVSCNASGVVARVPWKKLVEALGAVPPGAAAAERSVRVKAAELGAERAYVGIGARSLRLSRDEKTLFVTVNQTSELVGLDARAMRISARIPVDSFPVGLELSPDGSEVWVTSQGRSAKGGNSVGIFQARYKTEEIVPAAHSYPSHP